MNEYNKITALYSRLSVGDEDRDGGESNSIVNQKAFLERYAQQQRLTNIRHYIDDDESGRFFDRSAYSRMMEDVENGKIGVCIMKDLTRWGRDYLQVGNAMEVFRRNNVRFIAVNNGIDSDNPDTLEFAPFINGSNYNRLKPIHDELKTLKNGWGKKREKFEQAHESDLIIWNAANRFLHANLPEGTKSFKVSEWQKEFDELKAQSTGEYEELKTKRSEVKELQQIRKCIDIVEQAEQRTQEQTHQTPRRKKEDISL